MVRQPLMLTMLGKNLIKFRRIIENMYYLLGISFAKYKEVSRTNPNWYYWSWLCWFTFGYCIFKNIFSKSLRF